MPSPLIAQALTFLLPRAKFYVAVTDIHGQKSNRFFESIEDLAAYIGEQDRLGHTVYHACATFKLPQGNRPGVRDLGRSQANVAFLRSLFADIDVGPNKPYQEAADALMALDAFCAAAGMPPPTIVSSGRGFHAYWVLEDDLTLNEWQPYARGLKALCYKAGLKIDPARTADGSSILRTPGTTWRKEDPPRPVRFIQQEGPYDVQDFEFLKAVEPRRPHDGRVAGVHRGPQPAYLAGRSDGLAGAAARLAYPNNRSGERIADACPQMAKLRATGGNVSEPHWHHCLGVLAFCQDGERLGHEWSSREYDTYTEEETQGRLDRWKDFGPPYCQTFHDVVDSTTCENCPHWGTITTPIVLGQDDGRPEPAPAEIGGVTIPPLPKDFAINGSGLVLKAANNHTDVDLVISKHPIFLETVHRGEIKGDHTLSLKHGLPHRGWENIFVPASTLFGSGGIAFLSDKGITIHDTQHFLRFVRHSIDMYHDQQATVVRAEQFGWKEDDKAFLFGLNLYRANEVVVPAAGDDEIVWRSKHVGLAKGGSLHRWKELANNLFAGGCEGQSLALLASFAAPLLRFLSVDEGGAILSLVTRASGKGKSTALAGACSVWGDRDGLGLTRRDTGNTKGLTLGALGNLPVVYDEIETKDPQVARDFVQTFTEGRDKMRATRSGEIKHTENRWQTLLISGSNSSLLDTLSSDGAQAPATRIIEMSCDLPKGLQHHLGDKLKNELLKNYGYAGDAYLRYLMNNMDWVKMALEQAADAAWKKTNYPSECRFWIRTVAAIQVAGHIVKGLGLLEFSLDRLMSYLFQRLDMQRPAHLIAAMDGDAWAIDALGQFMQEHHSGTMAVQHRFRMGRKEFVHLRPRDPLVIRYETEENRYLIAMTALRKWLVKQQLPWNEFFMYLKTKGVAVGITNCTLGAGTEYPSVRVPVLEVCSNHSLCIGMEPQMDQDKVVRLVDGREALFRKAN